MTASADPPPGNAAADLHAVSKTRLAAAVHHLPVRIVFSSGPMLGHLNPMLPLALAAQAAGHDVVVATGPELLTDVARHGLVPWSIGASHAASGGREALSPEYFVTTGERRAGDLVPRALAWRPDIVIHEEMELAGAVAAAVTGARHVIHGFGLLPPAWVWAGTHGFAPVVERLAAGWGAGADVLAATYVRVSPPSLQPATDVPWADVRLSRPAFGQPPASGRLDSGLRRWIEASRDPIVHLTLGTVFHQTPGVLAAAIAGLRELPIRLVATTGPGVDPASFGRQPAHVRIVSYVPHAVLLPHCDLVVSHGGAGIMFGALAHGLPQLMLPQGADQFGNAAACRDAGVALDLAPDAVDAVAAAASRLLTEPVFARAAAAIGAELAAMPAPGEVVDELTRRAVALAR